MRIKGVNMELFTVKSRITAFIENVLFSFFVSLVTNFIFKLRFIQDFNLASIIYLLIINILAWGEIYLVIGLYNFIRKIYVRSM